MPRSRPHGSSVRVVADTNTVVSALLWGGNPAMILTAAREGRIVLCTSVTLLAELKEVLSRDKFAERLTRVGRSPFDLVDGYRLLSRSVKHLASSPLSRDPDDDHVLACALAADARLIVTRDQDLLLLGTLRGIRILPAREAMQVIDASSG